MLATVPFDALLSTQLSYRVYKQRIKAENGFPWVEILGVLKLGRVLRLNYIISYLSTTDEVKSFLKLQKLILYLIVYVHLFACAWWYVVQTEQVWIPVIDSNAQNRYKVYEAPFRQKYLYSLWVAVDAMLGIDPQPRTTGQTILISFGCFMGAVINANIFGELALIMQELNKSLKMFDLKISSANTVIINQLKLPFDLQQRIRHNITSLDPTYQMQTEMISFISMLKPSLKDKIKCF